MAKRKSPKPPSAPELLDSVRAFHGNIRACYHATKRNEPHITQKEFAERAGISLRTLGTILRGKSDSEACDEGEPVAHAATLRTIERAARGLKLETWQLLFPDFPVHLALSEKRRGQTQEAVRRYLNASEAVRGALAEILPPTPSN